MNTKPSILIDKFWDYSQFGFEWIYHPDRVEFFKEEVEDE